MTSNNNRFRLSALLAIPIVVPLLVILADATPALSQGDATLRVSNTGQPASVHTFPTANGRSAAQSFCTSNVAVTLEKVRLYAKTHMAGAYLPASVVSVSIHANDGGRPGEKLHTLTNPSNIDGWSQTSEDFTTNGFELAADTIYWVVVYQLDRTFFRLGTTNSHDEDAASEGGWAIADVSLMDYNGWKPFYVDGHVIRMEIHASGDAPTMSTPSFSSSSCYGSNSSYEFEVTEHSSEGTLVGEVLAREPDGDSLTYSLGGGNAGAFNDVFLLNANTGEITVKSSDNLDYESRRRYSITVGVTDGEDASGNEQTEPTTDSTTQVTILVKDTDDPGVIVPSTSQPRVRQQLTYQLQDPDGYIIIRKIMWSRGDSADGPFTVLSSGDNEHYTPTEQDLNKFLQVTVTYVDNGCIGSNGHIVCMRAVSATFANAVGEYVPPPPPTNHPPTGSLRIDGGPPRIGYELRSGGNFDDPNGLIGPRLYLYQWLSVDPYSEIEEILPYPYPYDKYIYVVRRADAGKALKLRVFFTDDDGFDESVTSELTPVIPYPAGVRPPLTGRPVVAGKAIVGQTLSADRFDYKDIHGIVADSVTYQWISNDRTQDEEVPNATGSSYSLADDDEGKTFRFRMSYQDEQGRNKSVVSRRSMEVAAAGATISASYHGVPDSHDGITAFTFELHFTTEPSIRYTVLRDHVLTVTEGKITDVERKEAGSNLKWKITLKPSGDADVTVLLPVSTDCTAQGAICLGGSIQLDRAVEFTVRGPVNETQPDNNEATGLPVITGTPQVGETLTVSTTGIADEDGMTNATFTYQWMADDTEFSDATGSTYTLVDADEGNAITVRVSFTDDAGNSEELTSQPTDSVSAASAANSPATGAPTVAGTAQVGETLTADTSGISDSNGLNNVSYAYQWIRLAPDSTETNIGTDSSTYMLAAADVGKTIKVKVTFTDDAGNSEELTSAATSSVAARSNRPATGAPTISGVAQVGQTLTANTSGIVDADGLDNVSYGYQWVSNDGSTDTDISGATGSAYTLVEADQGKTIRVRVTFTDDAGNSEELTSAATSSVAARSNRPATGAPAITGTARVGETLTVSTTGIADEDGMTNATFTYQWLADGADISGATGSIYTLVGADVGKTIEVRVSFTDDRGNQETLTSNPTGAVAAALPPLTASVYNLPASHDGSNVFIFDLEFSEEFPFSYITLRDHAFTVTGGEVINANRDDPPSNVDWVITVQPSGDGDVTVVLPVTTDCEAQGAICTADGRMLSTPLTLIVAAPPNRLATGAPTIGGVARVDQKLTADTSGINDADGLANVSYGYQWVSNDGSTDTDISGATGSTYTLAAADQGKTIKVRVAFTDDRGNQETLTSAATGAVAAAPSPLTVSAYNEPASHDGSDVFTFELEFSEEFPVRYTNLRDHAFTVTGGEVINANRDDPPSNVDWVITVQPSGDGDVTVVLPATTDCEVQGAICTADGRMLSTPLKLIVSGPSE